MERVTFWQQKTNKGLVDEICKQQHYLYKAQTGNTPNAHQYVNSVHFLQ